MGALLEQIAEWLKGMLVMSEGTAKENAENQVNTRGSGDKADEYGLKAARRAPQLKQALNCHLQALTPLGACFFIFRKLYSPKKLEIRAPACYS